MQLPGQSLMAVRPIAELQDASLCNGYTAPGMPVTGPWSKFVRGKR